MGNPGSKSQPDASEMNHSSTADTIHRLAVFPRTVIGSFYDVRRDYVVTTPPVKTPFISIIPPEAMNGPMVDVGILENRSLSDLIHIDKELYLSILSKIVSPHGLSSLIEYPFVINRYTRFLSYYYPTRLIRLIDQPNSVESKSITKLACPKTATHVVTDIQYGIHVFIFVQLSPEYATKLDDLLVKIKTQLTKNIFRIEPNEEDLYNKFIATVAFSNIPHINKLENLTNVCQKIIELKSNIDQHCALEYTLRSIRSIRSILPSDSTDNNQYYSLKEEYRNQLIEYLDLLILLRRSFDLPIAADLRSLFEKYLKQQFDRVQQQILNANHFYCARQDKTALLIHSIRSGEKEQDAIIELLNDNENATLLNQTLDAHNQFIALKDKAQLISDLKKNGISYRDVKPIVVDDDEDLNEIKKRLMKKFKRKRIFCFDDKLYEPHSPQWAEFYMKLVNTHKNNPQVESLYADFSYCLCKLLQMEILSSQDTNKQANTSYDVEPSSKKLHVEESNPPETNFVNVLLLGESGVGKSTFVNAVVNYLKFESLRGARSGQPIVLMPVSFLTTVGDNFEERMVNFGEKDPNEDHNQLGQSVTQCCRSYVFNIGTKTKLRLIDTPGMGDTRGLDQDDINMQQILSFINDLPHLNAISILLKPNESRLNVVFRSYFTRLLGFLGENVRNNIVFCFTNTRTTFFALGSTGPLLKKMLGSHSITNIPYGKTNTFCFDNKAFRYLMARLDGVEFDNFQKEEYKRTISKKNWQSIEHAQFQITQMIRPMLETLRNTFRNCILQRVTSSKLPIKLSPKALVQPSTICTLTCDNTYRCYSDFLIVPDILYTDTDKCNTCNYDRKTHINVEYKLEYENLNDTTKEFNDKMKSNLEQLQRMIFELAPIFDHIIPHSNDDDPIMIAVTRMVTEEEKLCSLKHNSETYLNPELLEELTQFNDKYKQKRDNSKVNNDPINLSSVYELIQNINQIDSINEQINAIKQFRQKCMRNQEKQISWCSIQI